MKKIFWCCVFLFYGVKIFAQGQYIKSDYYSNHTPKNPQASALGSFGNVPVNYYTGQPEISFNLMTLASRDLSLPISINYDASGVKTDEISGPIGLKWFLDAGGFITRELNGLPDENPSVGYWKNAKASDYYQNLNVFDWTNASQKNDTDCEPDMFTINIPGRSIKFAFTKDKVPFTIPRQNIKINYSIQNNNSIQGFSVITEDGTKYIFGGSNNSIEKRKIESLKITPSMDSKGYFTYYSGNGGPRKSDYFFKGEEFYDDDQTLFKETVIDFFNSKWYLISITSPSGDVISLNYQNDGNVTYATRPTTTRIRPLVVKIPSYTYTREDCQTPSPFGCLDWDDITFTVTDVLAIAKFTKPDPGSSYTETAMSTFVCPYTFVQSNTCPATTVSQSETEKYFLPQDQRADQGGMLIQHTLITESAIRLESIVSSLGNKVVITPSSREDLPGAMKYDYIKFYDNNDGLVKAIKLNMTTVNANAQSDYCWISEALMLESMSNADIFSGASHYANSIKDYPDYKVQNSYYRKYVYEGAKDYNYKRLFLESIEDVTNPVAKILYEFTYDSRNSLFRRTSTLHDVYGYPRSTGGNVSSITIAPNKTAIVLNAFVPNAGFSSGRNQTWGILNSIKYPTKGFTKFTFFKSMGVKLNLIQDYDENNSIVKQSEIEYKSSKGPSAVTVSYQDFKIKDTNYWMKYQITTSAPQNDSYSLTQGTLEGNKEVFVYAGTKVTNAGYERFVYRSPVDPEFSDEVTQLTSNPGEFDKNGSPLTVSNIFPFPRNQERDFNRGLLWNYQARNPSHQPLKEVINHFEINPMGYSPEVIRGFTGGLFAWSSDDNVTFKYGFIEEPLIQYRYATYKIVPDWIVNDQQTEITYDQTDVSKKIVKISKNYFDPQNLQLVKTESYLENFPSQKFFTKTKYATHLDYDYSPATSQCENNFQNCMSDCSNSNDPQPCQNNCSETYNNCMGSISPGEGVEEISLMRVKHQVSTPIEVISYVEKNGTTNFLSSVAYKFKKYYRSPNDYYSVYVKPSEIWGAKRLMPFSSFQESKVLSGQFSVDANMRKLHSFNTYEAGTGNILQQTLLDGTTSAYQWDNTNNLVAGITLNQQFQYNYAHKPFVGLLNSTDPNGIKNYYEYDPLNRLKLTRDHDTNIVSRYRYHYKDENEFTIDFSVTGNAASAPINFACTRNEEITGITTYAWDFGDGEVLETSSGTVDHTYATGGTYVVKLAKMNPEYGSIVTTKSITIYNPISITLSLNVPSEIDRCIEASAECSVLQEGTSGGCSALSYAWEIMSPGSSTWGYFGTSSYVQFNPQGFADGSYQVKCIASDNCGNTTEEIRTMYVNHDPAFCN